MRFGGGDMKLLRLILSDIVVFISLVGLTCLIVTIPLYLFSIPLNIFTEIGRWAVSVLIVLFILKQGYIKINSVS